MRRLGRATASTAATLVTATLLAACSGGHGKSTSSTSATSPTTPATTTAPTTTAPPRTPHVNAAALEGPITLGTLSPPADPKNVDLAAIGYAQEEYFASGTASAYTAGQLTADGNWTVTPTTTAPYKTRLIVRRPSDPARFDGTVVVEWLNVTVAEASPEWAYTYKAITDAGAAWVGVSVQALGVVGGKPLLQIGTGQQSTPGLKGSNPQRYGSLIHPGDQYAFDMFSQVGAALRANPKATGPVRRVIAAGESQSAAFLTTYINAVQPVANVFDGFFVHSRGAGAARLDGVLDIRGSVTAYRFRTDLNAPVMAFETETDVGPLLGYAEARQPDTDRLRVWEVAGTSHADAYLVNGTFAACPAGINNGPHHYVATAAMAHLITWVDDGTPPPHSGRIQANGTAVVRDAHGNALGGIRTPTVDVPAETVTGQAPAGEPVLCALFGSSKRFDPATLLALYPSKQAYLDAFDSSLDLAISNGFVRSADRAEFAAEARAVSF